MVGGCLGVTGKTLSCARAALGAGTFGGGTGGGLAVSPWIPEAIWSPTAPPYPPLGTASCLSAPSPLQPCVLVHTLSPAGRVGVCKRFALIWLNGKVGKLVGPGVCLPGVWRGDAAHLGHGERSQFLGCFLMNCFFFPFCLCHMSPVCVPSSRGQGCHCCPHAHPPRGLSSGILLQTEKSCREGSSHRFAE